MIHTHAPQAQPHQLDAAMNGQQTLQNLNDTAEASAELVADPQLAEHQLTTQLQDEDSLQKLVASLNGGNSEADGTWQQQAPSLLTALRAGGLSARLAAPTLPIRNQPNEFQSRRHEVALLPISTSLGNEARQHSCSIDGLNSRQANTIRGPA